MIIYHRITLPKNLQPGYVILADRGFNIEESSVFYYADFKLTLFLKVKKQLEGIDVQLARGIGAI